MPSLLLNTTPEEKLIAAIVGKEQKTKNSQQCYVFTTAYFSSDGGGGIDIKGVYTSKEKAAQAFVKAVKEEYNSQNEDYAEEGEVYFKEEPALDIWEDHSCYQFSCKNHLYDLYEWQLTPQPIQ